MFGSEVGQYDKRCIKSAERYWYNANKNWCPSKRTEAAIQECYEETEERYNIRKNEICRNNMPMPASCGSLSGREISALRAYNDKRLHQHNLRRELHLNTADLSFDLDLACQAKVRADAIKNGSADNTPVQGENLATRDDERYRDWPEQVWYHQQIDNYCFESGTSIDGSSVDAFALLMSDQT